jgi:hypothetical protein
LVNRRPEAKGNPDSAVDRDLLGGNFKKYMGLSCNLRISCQNGSKPPSGKDKVHVRPAHESWR